MSRKTPDWHKLVGKPSSHPHHLDQPLTAMIRTYPIGKVEGKFVRIGKYRSAHVFDYHELVKLMRKVERVRKTNTSVILTRGQSAIHASVRGPETSQELKARLRDRRAALKRNLRYARAEQTRRTEKTEQALEELGKLKPLLARKPAAGKKKAK